MHLLLSLAELCNSPLGLLGFLLFHFSTIYQSTLNCPPQKKAPNQRQKMTTTHHHHPVLEKTNIDKGKELEEEKPSKSAQLESFYSFLGSICEDVKNNPERYSKKDRGIQQPSLNDKAICEAALQKYNLDKGEEYEYWTVCSPYTSTVDGRYHFNFIGKHQTKSAEFFFADVGYVEPDNYDAVKCELLDENYYPGDEKVKWQFVIHPYAIPCEECDDD